MELSIRKVGKERVNIITDKVKIEVVYNITDNRTRIFTYTDRTIPIMFTIKLTFQFITILTIYVTLKLVNFTRRRSINNPESGNSRYSKPPENLVTESSTFYPN